MDNAATVFFERHAIGYGLAATLQEAKKKIRSKEVTNIREQGIDVHII